MVHHFRGIFPSEDFINAAEDLGLVPRIGRGNEARVNRRPVKFLGRIKRMMKTQSNSGRGRSAIAEGNRPKLPRGTFHQRVVIKTRVVRSTGAARRGLAKHIYYLQREGAGINGDAPKAFSAKQALSPKDLEKWAELCQKDRHHFRLIVSPENGAELDLKAYAKSLMRSVERDLDTKLDWIAVNHHNTDNPHVHILIRGKDERHKDLIINRQYISHGAREKAREIATQELGYRTISDIQRELQESVTKGRVVGLDHELIRAADWNPCRHIDMREISKPGQGSFARTRSLQLGRLAYLEGINLALEVTPGIWKLDDNLLGKLQDLSLRNDIIKTMHQRMRGQSPVPYVSIIDPKKSEGLRLDGKVIHVGLVNELYDTRYLMVEGRDHKVHYVPLGHTGTRHRREANIGDEVSLSVSAGKLEVAVLDRGRSLELTLERK